MSKVLAFLKGKKTYVVGLLIIVGVILEMQFGIEIPEVAYVVLAGLGFVTVRAGIADMKKNLPPAKK